MDLTVLGLPLAWNEEPDYTVSPYAALVVMKGIDGDGDDVFAVMVTEGMTPVEAGGLANYAKTYCNEMIKAQIYAATNQSQEKQVTGEESS